MLCAPPHRITCTFRRNDSIDRQSMETKIRSDFSKRCRKEFDFSLILLYCVLWGGGGVGGERKTCATSVTTADQNLNQNQLGMLVSVCFSLTLVTCQF